MKFLVADYMNNIKIYRSDDVFWRCLLIASLIAGSNPWALASTPPQPAPLEHGAHEHGVGDFEVSIEGKGLRLRWEVPADSVLGFEHAPRTAAQKSALTVLRQDWAQPLNLFAPSPEAKCQPQSTTLESDLFSEAFKGHHAELTYAFTLNCEAPEKLHSLEVMVFKKYKSLREVRVELSSEKGQKSIRLNRQNTVLRW